MCIEEIPWATWLHRDAPYRDGYSRVIQWLLRKRTFTSIIDFGCGAGIHVGMFAKAGKRAVGTDLCSYPCANEQAQNDGYTLIQGSWTDLPGESFDAGWSHHCLEHARDAIGWLHEWGRVIKPGGFLCVGVPPYRERVLAGHITNGWNGAQLVYLLVLAGWDCSTVNLWQYGNTLFAIAARPAAMCITDHEHAIVDWSGLEHLLPEQCLTLDRRKILFG